MEKLRGKIPITVQNQVIEFDKSIIEKESNRE